MRKFIVTGLVALTAAGANARGGAQAQYRHDRDRHHGDSGAAVAAGLAGLAVGAAIASGGRGDYDADHGYYRGYYRDGYYYGPHAYAGDYYYGNGYGGPRRCRTRTVWDPYVNGYVERTRCW